MTGLASDQIAEALAGSGIAATDPQTRPSGPGDGPDRAHADAVSVFDHPDENSIYTLPAGYRYYRGRDDLHSAPVFAAAAPARTPPDKPGSLRAASHEGAVPDPAPVIARCYQLLTALVEGKEALSCKAAYEFLVLDHLANRTGAGRHDVPSSSPIRVEQDRCRFTFSDREIAVPCEPRELAPLDRQWLAEEDADSPAWAGTTRALVDHLAATKRLTEMQIYGLTHFVFYLTNFGVREPADRRGLDLCRNLLRTFLAGTNRNLDLRLEARLACHYAAGDSLDGADIRAAKRQFDEYGFVGPTTDVEDDWTLYAAFHATCVYAMVGVEMARTADS